VLTGSYDNTAKLFLKHAPSAVMSFQSLGWFERSKLQAEILLVAMQFLSFPFSANLPWHSAAAPMQTSTSILTLDIPQAWRSDTLHVGHIHMASAAAACLLVVLSYGKVSGLRLQCNTCDVSWRLSAVSEDRSREGSFQCLGLHPVVGCGKRHGSRPTRILR
jgi:hypothetical protein